MAATRLRDRIRPTVGTLASLAPPRFNQTPGLDGPAAGNRNPGAQPIGMPSPRAMMLRWISEVPPAMVPAKLRKYRSIQLADR